MKLKRMLRGINAAKVKYMSTKFVPGKGVAGRPRFDTEPLPPYSYVPGINPHPVTDPAGHMHGHETEAPPPLISRQWPSSAAYLRGIDLFNHGYYWEAHEAWEGLWHAAGRQGVTGDFLKGLIKLAAAAVKLREGNPDGARRHTTRAQDLFTLVAASDTRFAGLELDEMRECAAALGKSQPQSTFFVADIILMPAD